MPQVPSIIIWIFDPKNKVKEALSIWTMPLFAVYQPSPGSSSAVGGVTGSGGVASVGGAVGSVAGGAVVVGGVVSVGSVSVGLG